MLKPSAAPPSNQACRRVGDALGRSAQHPMAARRGDQVVDVAQRHPLPPRLVQHGAGEGVVGVGQRQVGHRAVEVIGRHVRAEAVGQQLQRVAGIDEALQRGQAIEGLALGPPDHRHDAGQHGDVLRAAAMARQQILQRGVLRARLVEILHHGEHHIRRARREVEPRRRPARLQHHRPPLRRAPDVQRPLHREMRPGVIEPPHPRRIDIDAGGAIRDDRVIRPAIPQAAHHIDELAGDGIALRMVRMQLAEIRRRLRAGPRHRIPRRPPAADMVQRGEGARHGEGVAVGRRHRRAQPDMRRAARQRREHRQRFEPHRVGRMRARIGIEIVPHEDHVEAAAFGLARDGADRRHVLETVHRARIAPPRDMAAGAEDEQAEMHLSRHATHRQKITRRSMAPTSPKKARLIAEATRIADHTCTKSISVTDW